MKLISVQFFSQATAPRSSIQREKHFNFFMLPLDLRLLIYSYLLPREKLHLMSLFQPFYDDLSSLVPESFTRKELIQLDKIINSSQRISKTQLTQLRGLMRLPNGMDTELISFLSAIFYEGKRRKSKASLCRLRIDDVYSYRQISISRYNNQQAFLENGHIIRNLLFLASLLATFILFFLYHYAFNNRQEYDGYFIAGFIAAIITLLILPLGTLLTERLSLFLYTKPNPDYLDARSAQALINRQDRESFVKLFPDFRPNGLPIVDYLLKNRLPDYIFSNEYRTAIANTNEEEELSIVIEPSFLLG